MVKEVPQSVSQVYEEADGMAASPKMVAGAYEELLKSADKEVPAMQVQSCRVIMGEESFAPMHVLKKVDQSLLANRPACLT